MKMRKVLSLFLTGLICLTSIPFTAVSAEETEEILVWDGSADSFWYNDTDTEFHISTAEEFAGLAKLVNSGNNMEGKTIYLEDDIYLNDISDYDTWNETAPDNIWTSIGINSDNRFKGNFSGENHTVYGLYNQAVFGYADSNAMIERLHLKYSYITSALDHCLNNSSDLHAGSICACITDEVIIQNCTNEGLFDINTNIDNQIYVYVGGICGFSYGEIRNCSNKGDISFLQNCDTDFSLITKVGGICGFSLEDSIIENCSNYSNISMTSTGQAYSMDIAVGGICGKSNSKIINCYNQGEINASSTIENTWLLANGGIVGEYYENENDMQNCYNTGLIGTGDECGGIVGHSSMSYFQNCFYLNTSSLKGIGSIDDDTVINANETNMKKESFAQTLGDAFVYVEGDFPKLAWEVYGIAIEGDINNDGTLNVTDVVILQKYLLNAYSMSLDEWSRSDLCADGSVDVFDLCILKRLLISQ